MLRLPGHLRYIGETGRNLNKWLTEHKRATRNGDLNNNIAEGHLQTNQRINWDSAECVSYSTDYSQRLTLESWRYNITLTLKMTTTQVVETSVTPGQQQFFSELHSPGWSLDKLPRTLLYKGSLNRGSTVLLLLDLKVLQQLRFLSRNE